MHVILYFVWQFTEIFSSSISFVQKFRSFGSLLIVMNMCDVTAFLKKKNAILVNHRNVINFFTHSDNLTTFICWLSRNSGASTSCYVVLCVEFRVFCLWSRNVYFIMCLRNVLTFRHLFCKVIACPRNISTSTHYYCTFFGFFFFFFFVFFIRFFVFFCFFFCFFFFCFAVFLIRFVVFSLYFRCLCKRLLGSWISTETNK